MSDGKVDESLNASAKSGGRPMSDGWAKFDFSKVIGPKGKVLAKCSKCQHALTNTSISRMAKHRKKCGITPRLDSTQFVIKNEDKEETIEKVHIIESVNVSYSNNEDQNAVNTIYWATDDHGEQQHVLQVEKVHQPSSAVVEMVQVQSHQEEHPSCETRHERVEIRRPPPSKKSLRRSNNSSILDANLSRFIIGCNLSFDVIDSSHFKRFANTMNPDYVVPSSSQLKSRVLNQLQTLDPMPMLKSRKRRYEEYSTDTESD